MRLWRTYKSARAANQVLILPCANCRNTANRNLTTCINTDTVPLKNDDGGWKTLFGVPNNTHTDF